MKSLILLLMLFSFFYEAQAQDTLLNPADSAVLNNLSYNMTGYPDEALKDGIEGTVYVEFDIDSACRIINPQILKGVGYGCDEMALEIIKDARTDLLKKSLRECSRSNVRIPVIFSLH